MTLFDRLDRAVDGRWCPQEALGWASLCVGSLLLAGSVTTLAGLYILKDVIA